MTTEVENTIPLEGLADPRFDSITRNKLLADHATLLFLLSANYLKVTKKDLRVMHSLGDGVYCIDGKREPITQEIVDQLNQKMIESVTNEVPIEVVNIGRAELLKFFQEVGREDKIGVLKAWQDHFIPCIQFEDYIDYRIEEMCIDKKRLQVFEIRLYDKGLLLRFPTLMSPNKLGEWKDRPVLHDIFTEAEEWAKILKADNVAELNNAILTQRISEIRRINEGLHEKKISKIAQTLSNNFNKKRVILIAGASSSNKTTFAKRLCIQLRVSGYGATLIEMDDYFMDVQDIPVDKNGKRDFEHISALNVPILSQRVHELLEGKKIPQRKFNFKQGKGIDSEDKFLTLPSNNFLILEGIHGLNPELLTHIGYDIAVPLYVAALTPIHIDMNHRFPTSDLRLIRRCIRDFQYRGMSIRKTIQMWTTVRVGEERNIFPYHMNAEMFFNSALVYEFSVYTIFGRVLLSEATVPDPDENPDSIESKQITEEARRLLGLLSFFYPMSPEEISKISCIREFIGGSDLTY